MLSASRLAAPEKDLAQIGVFTVAPLWAFIVILLSVLVIYNLTVNWADAA